MPSRCRRSVEAWFAACTVAALLTPALHAAPAPPANLAAQVSGDTVLLTWSAPAGTILGYRLQAGTAAGQSNVADVAVGTSTQFTAPNVPPGTYYVRVRAFDASGQSAPSNEVIVSVAPPSLPGPPQNLSAQVTGSTVVFAWMAPSGPVTGYRLEARSAAGLSPVAAITLGPATQQTVNAVPPGAYFVRLRALSGAGAGPYSNEVLVVIGTPSCPIPPAPDAPAAAIGSQLTLSWTPLTLAGVGYVVEAGSQPQSSDLGIFPTGVNTTLTAPAPAGKYYVRVRGVAACGLMGPASAETVVVIGGQAVPVANAGADQSIENPSIVQLDGSASVDPDGASLTFKWSLLSRPAGSAAGLSQAGIARPTLFPDLPGAYVVQLIVSDGQFDSVPDTVVVTRRSNSPPVADAGPDQLVTAQALVQLNGGASSDADGDALTYAWSFVSNPPGGQSSLIDGFTVAPRFYAFRAGVYVIQLLVSDGRTTSVADTVAVTVRLQITGASLSYAHKDQGNIIRLSVWGGDSNYAASLDAGTLPPGLAFGLGSTCGVAPPGGCIDLTGIATQAGVFPMTVRITAGPEQWGTFDLTVIVTTQPVVVTAGLPAGEVNVAYTATLQASGGDGMNYEWSIASGTLPPGLTLDAVSGAISGIPTQGGAFDALFRVRSGQRTAQRHLVVAIAFGPVPPTSSIMVWGAFNTSCQVRNSELTCWGGEYNPTAPPPRLFPTAPMGAVPVREINDTFCAITLTGGALCWPEGVDAPPVTLPGASNLIALGGGRGLKVCGLSSGGSISCWTVVPDAPNPPIVGGPFQEGGAIIYAAIAETGTRNDHNCALTAAGAAYCWGVNTYGELGDGTTNDAPVNSPVAVTGGHVFASLSVGISQSCGVTASGDLYCWGSNENGMLGVGEHVTTSAVPLQVMAGTTFKPAGLTTHSRLTCAVTTAGRPYCWGNVGIAFSLAPQGWTPQPIAGDVNFATIRANHRRLCGIDTAGASWCMFERPLGDGSQLDSLVPVRVLIAPP